MTHFWYDTFTTKTLSTTEKVYNDIANPVNEQTSNVYSTGSLVDEGNTLDSTTRYVDGGSNSKLTNKYKSSKF